MTYFAVYRPIATAMAYAALAILGTLSFHKLEVSLFPDIAIPKIHLLTSYPGVAPEEIEDLLTRPLEEAASSINHLSSLYSRSEEGISNVEVELEWGASLDLASIALRQKIDLLRPLLPQDASRPIIVGFSPSSAPILTFIARPTGIPFPDLRVFAERQLRPLIERAEGVAAVSIWGGYQQEIQVKVDRDRIYALGISLEQIGEALAAADFRQPIGVVKEGELELNVRLEGGFRQFADIGQTAIGLGAAGTAIPLRRVAAIDKGLRKPERAALYNGKPAVIVAVRREPGKNILATAKNIKRVVDRINQSFGKSATLELIQDQSLAVANAIADLRNAILLGAAGAMGALFFFLRSIRSALIVLSAIPFTVLSAFILMRLFDISINIISLGGISLGIGLLIDNAIVVLESIHQRLEQARPKERAQAILLAVKEVSASVGASTFTSVIVFAPIIFVTGLNAELFRELALTVSFSLISSLIIAFSLIPMLSLFFGRIGRIGRIGRAAGVAGVGRERAPQRELPQAPQEARRDCLAERLSAYILRLYSHGIDQILHSPLKLTLSIVALAIIGLLLLLPMERRLFPKNESGIIEAEIDLPAGSSLQQSLELHKQIHLHLLERDLAEDIITDIGYEKEDMLSLIEGARHPNSSQSIFYINRDKIDSRDFILYMQNFLQGAGELKSAFRQKSDPLQELVKENDDQFFIDIESRDKELARQAAIFIYRRLEGEPILQSLQSTATADLPEVRINLDREKLASIGILPAEAAIGIYQALHGSVVAIYRKGDQEIDIRLRLQKQDRQQIEELERLYISANSPASAAGQQDPQVRLGGLIKLKKGQGHTSILRRNQQRLERIELSFDPHDQKRAASLLESIRKESAGRFQGVEMNIHRDDEEAARSLKDLLFALLLSAILVYLFLAAQFESLLHPLGLACAIPMLLPGAALGLLIGGDSININSVTGMIILTGLAINSVALLYESIRRQKQDLSRKGEGTDRNIEQGKNQDIDWDIAGIKKRLPIILKASGQRRIRPILITTFTTLLALLPLSLGIGGELQASMATTVIGGLLSVGLFTLFLFPALYYNLELLRIKTANWLLPRGKDRPKYR